MNSLFASEFVPADARALAGQLKALADPSRLQILRTLAAGPAANVDLQPALGGLSQPTVSHHLAILDAAGLISSRKEGVYIVRELNRAALADLLRLVNPAVSS